MSHIALIGAGHHLPALLDYERRHSGTLRVAVVCDRDRGHRPRLRSARPAIEDRR